MPFSEQQGGSLASYQGFACTSWRVRRSTGFGPDSSLVSILLKEPGKLPSVTPPVPGQEHVNQAAGSNADLAGILAGTTQEVPREVLQWSGDLLIYEEVDGVAHQVKLENMLVEDVSLEGEGSAVASVVLLDQRALWEDHSRALPQWLFNVTDGAGVLIPGSQRTDVDGQVVPWTVESIVRFCARHLPGSPEVQRVPDRWRSDRSVFKFEPYPHPLDVLREVLSKHKGRLSLQPDNRMAFYLEGEGEPSDLTPRVSEGGIPTQPIPASYWVRELSQVESGLRRPPRFVIVVGKERRAEVQIDGLEPVLRLDSGGDRGGFLPQDPARSSATPGNVVNLEDGFAELLRVSRLEQIGTQISTLEPQAIAAVGNAAAGITPGSIVGAEAFQRIQALRDLAARERARQARASDLSDFDRAWLRSFPLRPSQLRYRRDLTRRALAILERDAWRLWGLPGRETYNAHLLPIGPRCVTDSKGSPLPPAGFTYRFVKRTTPVAGTRDVQNTLGPIPTRAEQDLQQARAKLRALTGLIYARARQRLDRNEIEVGVLGENLFRSSVQLIGGRAKSLVGVETDLQKELERALANPRGAWGAGVQALRTKLYQEATTLGALRDLGENPIERLNLLLSKGWAHVLPEAIEEVTSGELGGPYGETLQQVTRLEQTLSVDFYDLDLAVQLARLMIQAGETIRERAIRGRQVYQLPQLAEGIQILGRFADRLRTFREREQRGEAQAQVLRQAEGEAFLMAVHYVNRRRAYDAGLRLESPELGLWRSSAPLGHLDPPDVPDTSSALLVPRAHAVRFGVTTTPRGPVRRRTGSGAYPWAPQDEPVDLVSQQLLELQAGDDLGVTLFAFTLQGSKVVEVPISELPADRGKPVRAPDLQELLLLPDRDGDPAKSNREELLEKARALAAAELGVPDGVSGASRVYLRPWQVQPDGWVSGVEWASAPEGGTLTRIVTGREGSPFLQANKSRERPRQVQQQPARRPEEPPA